MPPPSPRLPYRSPPSSYTDAMGVRRAAGEQAKAINQITEYLGETDKTGKMAEIKESIGTLEVSLGHTPFEVLCGALLGICVALLSA